MARIRSIKPDFFTSETVGRLTKSARLTFIGLWTHVDDNGVCVMNEMLICAALYPLDDPMDSLFDLQEDLRRIAGEGLVTIYQVAGKRYLFVNSWDEHQKISHPGKPRYPRPTVDGCEDLTSNYAVPLETFRRVAGERRETLRPEQGAGSREQGEISSASTASDGTSTATAQEDFALIEAPPGPIHPFEAPRQHWTADQIYEDPYFEEFWLTYPLKVDKTKSAEAWLRQLRKGVSPDLIVKGAAAYRDDPERSREKKFIKHPPTWLNGKNWADEQQATPPPPLQDPHDYPWGN